MTRHGWRARVAAWTRAAAFLAAAAIPADVAKGPWSAVTSPHFVAYTDGDGGRVADLLRDLERLREVLGRTTRGLAPDTGVPVVVLAFKSTDEFGAYAAELQHGNRRVAGYFDPGIGASYLVVNLASKEDPFRVAHHEFLHLVLAASVPGVPLWLNEGLAEYYSTFHAEKSVAVIGRPIDYHVATLERRDLIPLEHLLTIDEGSPEYHEPEAMQIFYAESWHLVHLMMHGSEADRAAMGDYLTRVRRGEPPRAAFANAILPATLAELEVRLQDDVKVASYPYTTWTFDVPFDFVPANSRAVTPAEALFQLGDYLRRGGVARLDDARAHFEATLAREPKHAAALAAIGRIAEAGEDTVAADAAYAAALASPVVDVRARMLVAEGWLERASRRAPYSNVPADSVSPDARRARALLETELVRRPNDLALLALYGRSFVGTREDLPLGIDALTRVTNAWPYRSDAALDLVRLYTASGSLTAARRLADDRLFAPAEPGERRAAWDAIVAATLARANESVEGRRYIEAESLLVDFERACPDARGRSQLASAYVDARVQEAVAMMRSSGKGYAEGVARLEALLDEPIAEPQRLFITNMLRQARVNQ